MSGLAVTTNPLSCARCKEKKIRCNKVEPVCDRCRATNAECVYHQRRSKVRKTRTRGEVLADILRRLDRLERNSNSGSSRSTPNGSTPLITQEEDISSDEEDDMSIEMDEEDGSMELSSSSMYKMFNEARSTTFSLLSHTRNSPADSTSRRSVEGTLDRVLENFQHFKLKVDRLDGKGPSQDIPKEFAKRWVKDAYDKLGCDMFLNIIDIELMLSLPDIIGLQHVHADISAQFLMYTMLFVGWKIENNPPPEVQSLGDVIYLKCLELVPKWQKITKVTSMDLAAATIMVWVAIDNFDYHLSWQFHAKACKIARSMKLHLFDSTTKRVIDGNEAIRNGIRIGMWELIQTDYLFQLYYDKPSALTNCKYSVDLPSLGTLGLDAPAVTSITLIVSTKICFIIKDFLETWDQKPDDLMPKVLHLCNKLEAVMLEWNLRGFLESSHDTSFSKWLYAEMLIHGYTAIIQMERKAIGNDYSQISLRSIEAARQAISVVNMVASTDRRDNFGPINFVAFYPFVAFFTLYNHILHLSEPNRVAADLTLMERLGDVMTRTAASQKGLIPIACVVKNLNVVLRHMLSMKTAHMLPSPGPEAVEAPQADLAGPLDPELGINGWPFQMSLQEGMQSPLTFMQTVESDLFARNWHDSWWDTGANMTPEQQQAQQAQQQQ